MSFESNHRFSQEELQAFRDMLESQRRILSQLIKENEEIAFKGTSPSETGEISRNRLHPADLASDDQEQDIALSLSEQESRELQAIEAALLRLDSGEYGICQECEEEISKGRLSVAPASALCIDCQSDLEHSETLRQRPNADKDAPSFRPIVENRAKDMKSKKAVS